VSLHLGIPAEIGLDRGINLAGDPRARTTADRCSGGDELSELDVEARHRAPRSPRAPPQL